MPVLIDLFEVPPGADETFLSAWDLSRSGSRLYRALRDDARFRFVEIGRPGPYEVEHDEGDVIEASGTILVTPYEVAPADDDAFLAGWHRVRDALAGHRGYLGTRLHRATDALAGFRWIEVARWSSPLMLSRARQDPAVASATEGLDFRAYPALYELVRGLRPSGR